MSIIDFNEIYNLYIKKLTKLKQNNEITGNIIFFIHEEILNNCKLFGDLDISNFNEPKIIFKSKTFFLEVILENNEIVKWKYKDIFNNILENCEKIDFNNNNVFPEGLKIILQRMISN